MSSSTRGETRPRKTIPISVSCCYNYGATSVLGSNYTSIRGNIVKMPSQVLWLSFALLFVIVGRVPAMAEEVHVGNIVFAGDGKLVISDVDDANEVFVVSEDAKITRDGKAANLSDLAAGDAARVTATRKNGKLVATAIVAKKGK